MTDKLIICNLIITILILVYLLSKKHWIKKANLFAYFKKNDLALAEYEDFIGQMSDALHRLSNKNIGALIVIERKYDLKKYKELGCKVNAKLSAEFLMNIFSNKQSAMHDGGVIVKGNNIVAVSAYFPIASDKMLSAYGARHRAAFGITQITDSIAIIVSETNGAISIVIKGGIEKIEITETSLLSTKLFNLFNFYIS